MKKKDSARPEAKRSNVIAVPGEIFASSAQRELDTAPLVDQQTVQTIAGVVSALAYIFATTPGANVIVAGVVIVGLFLPAVFPENAFDPLSAAVMGLVAPGTKRDIMDSAIAKANAAVKKYKTIADDITNDFNVWKNTSDADVKKDKATLLLHSYMNLIRGHGAQLIADFALADVGGAMLPQFVVSASRFLKILTMYYPYAEELSLPGRRGFIDRKANVLAELRETLDEMTDTAITLYRLGVLTVVLGGQEKTRGWVHYNDYRNTMTITALDLLPAWAFLDPVLYPSGCHNRSLNRRRVTSFDTYYDRAKVPPRHEILRYDSYYYFLRPVMYLKTIRLTYGRAYLTAVHDGLFTSQCTLNSIDGSAFTEKRTATGDKREGGEVRHWQDLTLGPTCFGVAGWYWNGQKFVSGPEGGYPQYRPVATIAEISFVLGRPNDRVSFVEKKLILGPREGIGFTSFRQSIPDGLARVPLLPSDFSEILVDFDSIPVLYDAKFVFILTWQHKSALQDLLPASTHVENAALNPVEQFHAIKAAKSIIENKLEIKDGPGFTGGDLVKVPARSVFSYHLKRDPARWFSGVYQVRLWYVNMATSGQAVLFSVRIVPDGGAASSMLNGSISALSSLPDLANLQYRDLLLHTFSGQIVVVAGMPGFTLSFMNNSSEADIVVDRIELIFVRAGTLDDTLE